LERGRSARVPAKTIFVSHISAPITLVGATERRPKIHRWYKYCPLLVGKVHASPLPAEE
jgi:hypothetical protein